MAANMGSNRRSQGEPTGDGVTTKLHHPAAFGRGLLGLTVASTAITMAVTEPPPWLNMNAYFVALSVAFFAGMAQVIASVRAGGWVTSGCGHGAGSKLAVLVIVAAGLSAASLLLLVLRLQ